MTPLEAARKMADPYDCPQEDGKCWYCHQNINLMSSWHAEDCPWLAMPQIVAALEAADAYLAPGAEGGGSLARLLALEAALKG